MQTCKSKVLKAKQLFNNQILQSLVRENVGKLNIGDNFESWSEVQKFLELFGTRFPRNVLILDFVAFSKELNFPETFELNHEYRYWGPQILIFGNLIFHKQPDENSFSSFKTTHVNPPQNSPNSFNIKAILRGMWIGELGYFSIDSYKSMALKSDCTFQNLVEQSIKASDLLCIRFLKLFRLDLGTVNSDNIRPLELASQNDNSKSFFELIGSNSLEADDEIKDGKILSCLKLNSTRDNFNLLMIAAQNGNRDVVKFFLSKQIFDINRYVCYDTSIKTAASLALDNKHFDVLLLMLKYDSKLPKFDVELPQDILEFLDDLKCLHELIQNGSQFCEIKQILSKYPTMRYFYNSDGESAAATALKFSRIEIYANLLLNGVYLSSDEHLQILLKSYEDKANVRNVQRNLLKLPYDEHLLILLTHCFVGHDVADAEKPKYNELILKALNKLNEISELKNLLELVSVFVDFKLTFEFNRDTIEQIDPFTRKGVLGQTYQSGWIFIGAKGLKCDENSEEYSIALGTVAHEICHLAMQLTFNNDLKPYEVGGLREYEYNSLVSEYKKMYDSDQITEKIISNTFNYRMKAWPIELVVRVPEILAYYRNKPQDLRKLKSDNPKLFNFFASLQETLKKAIDKNKLIKNVKFINRIVGYEDLILNLTKDIKLRSKVLNYDASRQTQILKSNCQILTLKVLKEINLENSLIFLKLESSYNDKIAELIQELLKLSNPPSIVISSETEFNESQISEISEKFKTKLIFITEQTNSKLKKFTSKIEHKWKDFSYEGNIFASASFIFQDAHIQFADIFKFYGGLDHNRLILDGKPSFLEFMPMKLLFDKNLVKIGKKLRESDKFYYDRELLDSTNNILNIESVLTQLVLILSDQPGMGKSTTFQKFALTLKERNPLKWVFYVDLKLFFKTFKIFRGKRIISEKDIVEIFSSMMNLSKLEQEMFRERFNLNEVIFLFDGVDEISPDFKDFIVKFMTQIINLTGNKVWIASRPNCVKQLKESLQILPYKLSPIKQNDFIEKFFEFNKIEDRERLQNLLDFMRKEWHRDYKNPLLIMIALEIHNELSDDEDIYAFFKIFFEKKLEVIVLGEGKGDLRKSDLVRDSKNLQFHQKIALKHLIVLMGSKNRTNFMRLQIMKVDRNELPVDTIFGLGILYGDDFEHCFFTHQMFFEFLVANYIVDNILTNLNCNDDEKELRMELFWLIMTHKDNVMVQKFIECFLNKNEEIFDEDHSDLGNFIKRKFNEMNEEFKDNIMVRQLEAFNFGLVFTHIPMNSIIIKFIQKIANIKHVELVKRCYKEAETVWDQMPDFPYKNFAKEFLLSQKLSNYKAKFELLKDKLNENKGEKWKNFVKFFKDVFALAKTEPPENEINDEVQFVIDAIITKEIFSGNLEENMKICEDIFDILSNEDQSLFDMVFNVSKCTQMASPLFKVFCQLFEANKIEWNKHIEALPIATLAEDAADLISNDAVKELTKSVVRALAVDNGLLSKPLAPVLKSCFNKFAKILPEEFRKKQTNYNQLEACSSAQADERDLKNKNSQKDFNNIKDYDLE